MVSGIIGNYLIEKGVLTREQLDQAIEEQQKARVKLGLIAVAEGLMTTEEADIVNMLQTAMDKRFGDIAVEKGYLTQGQVEALLKKQGNAYLAFAQALENLELMTFTVLEQHVAGFQQENQFTASDIEDLKSDDADRIIKVFLDNSCQPYMPLVATAFRTLMRTVDSEIYPARAYLTDFCAANTVAMQRVDSTPHFTTALLGMEDDLLPIAVTFGKEDFSEMNEDALDAGDRCEVERRQFLDALAVLEGIIHAFRFRPDVEARYLFEGRTVVECIADACGVGEIIIRDSFHLFAVPEELIEPFA